MAGFSFRYQKVERKMVDVLRKKELQELSGATQRRKLVRWLDELGVRHIPDANGWPIVERSALFPIEEPARQAPKLNLA